MSAGERGLCHCAPRCLCCLFHFFRAALESRLCPQNGKREYKLLPFFIFYELPHTRLSKKIAKPFGKTTLFSTRFCIGKSADADTRDT